MKTSVIIPAYNEEEHIKKGALNGINAHEIIAVNDGSQDNTAQELKKWAKKSKKNKIVSYKKNRGKGYAMRAGARKATGDIIVFTESDRQFSHDDIPRLVSALQDADLVISRRKNRSVIPKRRKFNIFMTQLATWMATGIWFTDPLSGFRAIRRSDFKKLKLTEDRFNIESEMNIKAARTGLKNIDYVPVHVTYHSKEFNKFNWKSARQLIWYLVKAVLRLV